MSDDVVIHLRAGDRFAATNGCYVLSESLYMRYRKAVAQRITELHDRP